MAIRTAIHGAAGRMGQRLIVLGHENPALQLTSALDSQSHERFGQDAGVQAGIGNIGLPLTDQIAEGTEIVIDFSVPDASEVLLQKCLQQKVALVLATTGFDERQKKQIEEAAKEIPILWAPSMSLTVNLTMKLCEIAGTALKNHPSGADVEILERHHRFKEDSPSGTALAFGEKIAAVMGQTKEAHGRVGRPGMRPHNEIGYHAIRTGDNPGEHTILFGLLGETIELKVAATNRDCYAHGAFVATEWLAGKPAGLYNMNDVLGL